MESPKCSVERFEGNQTCLRCTAPKESLLSQENTEDFPQFFRHGDYKNKEKAAQTCHRVTLSLVWVSMTVLNLDLGGVILKSA